MNKKLFLAILTFFLLSPLTSRIKEKQLPFLDSFSLEKEALSPQEIKRQKYDYMSTFLSRNTKPLGLKEDETLINFLKEPTVKWVIRTSEKHILE